LTITVTDVNDTNHAPTNIALSPSSVAENQPIGTQVGTLTTTDADAGDTFTYTLVSGSGAGDNGSFQIAGDKLQTKAVFDFETKSSYSIRVRTTDSGNASFEKVFTITITDAVDSYTIGGSVTGLSGSGLQVRNNGADTKGISAGAGSYTFATPVPSGQSYLVTIFTQPTSPWQTCTVANGSGTVANANVTNANIACTTNTYTVGGTVSGLTGTGLQLRNNNGNTTSISGNGGFTFSTQIASGQGYNVTVFKQPTNQTCSVGNGSGTIGGADVSSVTISCT
jgi:Cadherin domain